MPNAKARAFAAFVQGEINKGQSGPE
jgi:hypothetical protein